ncbi:uncharacterized protein LOC135841338 [Planococcus citri]|uniref:uncharacterized protein LOC135841338 n=1 Tax=Planococcus citri TaxID=170843 RepID=UPI0031F94DF8
MSSNSNDNFETAVGHQKAENMMRSQFYDVMVTVDTDVYYLNKFQLAWKSDYFEKLFTKYSDGKECSLVELPLMDTDTFSVIVDIMYGEELKSVLNYDNYVTLILAMDYLQMEIDLKTYSSFIEKNPFLDMKILNLLHFVQKNPHFHYLKQAVFKYLSVHWTDVRIHDEILSLPVDNIVGIISSETYDQDTSEMRKICKICSEWIYHDLESRLPHATMLVNAAKRRFSYRNEMEDQNFSIKLHDTERIKPEIIAKTLYKLLVNDGEIKVVEELLKDDGESTLISVDEGDKRKKLLRLLENDYFWDIAVKVEEKTYKLHRFKLNSASGYFAEIFSVKRCKANTQCTATPTTEQPNESEEYLLHDIDQTTFDMITKFIYFEEMQITPENVTVLLKAAHFLRTEELFNACVLWMKKNIEEVLTNSELGDTLPVCLTPFDVLEDLLLSLDTPSKICFDNPLKIVDVCSKWVIHDPKNRYHLIPQIALAINRNRMIDYNDYKLEAPADLNNCSEQLVRNELWKSLCSSSLVPSTIKTPENYEKKLKEIPVFIASTEETIIHLLDSDLNQIASFCALKYSEGEICDPHFQVSATLMGDNLFILFSVSYNDPVFYVYNLFSKKFISLNSCVKVKGAEWRPYSSLLNCRDEVYCCFKDGRVLKYSIELNRWMIFSEPMSDSNEEDVLFTSSRKKLYRLYRSSEDSLSDYVMEEFNFQQNVWSSLPNLSFNLSSYNDEPVELTITNDRKLTVIFLTRFMSFYRNSKQWRNFPRERDSEYVSPYYRNRETLALTQYEGRLLHFFVNKLYYWCAEDRIWVLKKQLPFRSVPAGAMESLYPYYSITAIQRCT